MRLFALVLLGILVSCRPETEKPPADLLGKEDMVSALIRIHLLETDLELRQLPADSANQIFKREESKILKNLKIDENRFRSSYDFYLKHPEYLDIIYATVVDSLSLREGLIIQKETGSEPTVVPPSPTP